MVLNQYKQSHKTNDDYQGIKQNKLKIKKINKKQETNKGNNKITELRIPGY
jgi:hypothetical protein